MRKLFLAGVAATAAITLAPLAHADPTPGHSTKVKIPTPAMLCEIGSDDSQPGRGPNVVCQRGAGFVGAPAGDDQAWVDSLGRFGYRTANIATGYDHPPFDTLATSWAYDIQGWTIVGHADGFRFTNDATAHGMFIGADATVNSF